MDTRTLLLRTAAGLLVLGVAACGGGATAADPEAPAAPALDQPADDATTVDPNDPAAVGAVIYDEEVPVPGTTLNACELVTASDVQAVVQAEKAIDAGTLKLNPTVLSPGHSACTYDGEFGRVIVELTPEDGANLYDAAYGAYKGREVISGLGDGAFWSDKNHRGFVWQEKVTAMFTILANDSTLDPMTMTKDLGAAMLAKL
jgi:hypothetical protein